MAVHELLSPAQREVLTEIPARLGARLLARYYTFSREDLLQIRAHRKPANRLGFGVQLCYLRFPGRALAPAEVVPADLLAHVAAQLRLDPGVFADYAQRDQTRREHLVELQHQLGFRSFSRRDYMELARELLPLAHSTEDGLALVTALVEACRARRIILPAILTLERLAWGVHRRAQQHVYQVLLGPLTAAQRRALATLLVVPAGGGLIPLTWLRQPPGAPKPAPFKRVVARLSFIRALGLPALTAAQVHPNRLLQLAREGARLSPQRLRNLPADQRDATLVAFLHHQATELTDQALAIHDQIFAKLLGRSAHQQGAAFTQDGRAINQKVVLYARVGRALIKARDANQDAYAAITTVLPWDRFVESVDEAEKLARPEEFDFLELLDTHYTYLREYSPLLLATFEFKAAPSHRVLLAALLIIKELNVTGKRKLPATVPLAFVPLRWEKLVLRAAGVDRHYYEMCALAELRDGLRAGDVWVAGSRRFKDLEDYLLPAATWAELRAGGVLPLAVPLDFWRYLDQRADELHHQLSTVADLLATNQLPGVSVRGGELHISALAKAEPAGMAALTERIYDQLPRTKITDLLAEVAGWTGFDRFFTHLHSGAMATDREALFMAILAEGINLGPSKMADACEGLSYQRLAWTTDWYLREETYRKALAEIINFQHRLPFAAYWGTGTTSSSDAQAFPVGGRRELRAAVNAHYGSEPVIKFYGHISDQYGPYYMQPISALVREAPYALDGLLYHETELQIREHYTDTGGYTDQVFAMFTLLGFRFAPRLRNLSDHRLYTIADRSAYPTLAPLIGGELNVRRLGEQWEGVLRLATSIWQGTVTASLILSKLAAYPRQNSLAWALREQGRLEKTLWVLEWLQDPALRRRVLGGLNKGEARHSLARAVCLHRRGAIYDPEFEAQYLRASGLNLLVAAIVTWNTVYLADAVERLRGRGGEISEEQLRHFSPLGWEHINLTGDYRWNMQLVTGLGQRRPLRRVPPG
jgi:TnpA family transposase